MIPIPSRIVHDESWHEERKKGIGGSEWPDILSMHYPETYKYNCIRRFWYQKRGIEPDFGRKWEPQLIRGLLLEPIIKELYEARMMEEETDFQFIPGPFLFSDEIVPGEPRRDWWIGNRDDAALVEKRPRICEWKSMNGNVFRGYRRDGLPPGYRLQPQHYMALYTYEGKPFEDADLAVYSADNSGFEIEPIPRDEETLILMLDAGDHVWKKIVPADEPPDYPPLTKDRCGNCQYRMSCMGPDYYKTHIIKLADLTDDEELFNLLVEYDKARTEASAADKEKKRLRYLLTKHNRLHHSDPEHFFCKKYEVKYEKYSDGDSEPKRRLFVRTPDWRREMFD